MVLRHGIRQLAVLALLLFGLNPMVYGQRSTASEMGLDQSVDSIRGRTGGRILSAETRQSDGRRVHHIRVLTPKGKVRRYRLDAATGRELPAGRRR